jgi:hypothetical protein
VFGSNRVRSFSIQVADSVPIEQGMVDLERVLRREHKIRPGGENDFTIRNQQDVLATQQQATQVFTSLLASIAAVSLVVGGIGIMNIMLVSVTERTREIGVRKALGATRLNILMQFLIEALTLCLLGGVLGILLGVGAAILLSRVMQWNTLISPPLGSVRRSDSSSGCGRPDALPGWIPSWLCGTSRSAGLMHRPKLLPALFQLCHEVSERGIVPQRIEGGILGEEWVAGEPFLGRPPEPADGGGVIAHLRVGTGDVVGGMMEMGQRLPRLRNPDLSSRLFGTSASGQEHRPDRGSVGGVRFC